MRLVAKLLAGSALATCLTGCMAGHRYHGHRGGQALALGAGFLVGAAIAEAARSSREPEDAERPYRFYSNGYFNPPATPRSPKDLLTEKEGPPPFDLHAARAALGEVDLAGCGEAGVHGFGHARITIMPNGRIAKVVIDEPPGMSAAEVSCIGQRLGAATLPPFHGSPVTMGTTYRVP
jgi:hypothetical protein